MLAQAAMAYYFDPNVENVGQAFETVNWWQVGRSAAEGLIPWKTPGGKIGRAAATASGDVLANAIYAGSSYSKSQALQDFAVGFIGDLAGGGLGELTAKYGSKAIAKGLSKMGFEYGDVNKMLGGGIKNNINETVNGVTAKRKMVGWAEGKVAVIGRDQKERVNKFAEGIGAETWDGFDINLPEAENIANNKKWIQGLKDEGYTIYDTGTGPKSPDKGAYYGMETKEVFDDN
ncbi:hypothetical protein ULMS_08830 [Patiriisocius marinistellae]|uniref:Pre-toxin TG domain-containing protein n=1 Tax=Patiriisocius marinistellae TaxID=2494560 RepID=A0A5J4FZE2_9FLAO|nr:hypothetical protein [Patiriisocius marinistellae]GEQ85375.1 hypothetical protein ULMS_08830 [Patiriisocius marinistellae]